VASHEAVSVLREALNLVKGPPLDDVAYDWLSAETSLRWVSAGLVHEAATLLLHLASDPASLLTARTALEALDSQEVDSRC
jgi:hypothetical protein